MGNYGYDQPEVRLHLVGGSASGDSDPNIGRPSRGEKYRHGNAHHHHHHLRRRHLQQQQQIALSYYGWVCVCDVTEIQARSIICMARREMEERTRERWRSQYQHGDEQRRSPPPQRAVALQLINPDLSMKRSLQRFLRKRKSRMDASAPYSYAPETP